MTWIDKVYKEKEDQAVANAVKAKDEEISKITREKDEEIIKITKEKDEEIHKKDELSALSKIIYPVERLLSNHFSLEEACKMVAMTPESYHDARIQYDMLMAT